MIDSFLGEFRWYRRWRGGRWEYWYNEVVNGYAWFRCPHGIHSGYVQRGPLEVEEFT